ncbi:MULTISPECIES: pyridoxamine 5'-phosphate oxidase family protein [unclassified Mannheimia]|uniref:pyridoxamine 5'-phosphate oxidase family protein n=1 Tax=unclassified Mannheimia TaxID=2645054 RepID=UPI00359E1355
MTNPIPSHIIDFIQSNHVVNFATHNNDDFWAANCFYAFDQENARLIILTAKKTRHAQIMLENPQIVGTICGQIEKIKEIEGVQFSATAKCLEDKETEKAALQIYYEKHPLARLKPSDVWEISFNTIKHTGNKFVFAQKSIWSKNATQSP